MVFLKVPSVVLLFLMFVNDLPQWIQSSKMFADDAKMWAIIKNEEDADKLHMHLDRLMDWSDRWLPRQNSENCKIMHIGQEEKHREYKLYK